MVTHYFTLRALARELHSLLCGSVIDEIFTQSKNQLIISVHQTETEARECSLNISIDPKLNYCYMREKVTRAKKNSVDLFRDIAGLSLKNISMHPYDRIVQLEMENNWKLCMQLYNTVTSNIILLDEQNTIREAFKNNKELKGTSYAATAQRGDQRILSDAELFRNELTADSSKAIFVALKTIVPLFGSTYTREALHRTRVEEKKIVNELHADEIERIWKEVRTIFKEMERCQPIVYYRGEEAKVLSVIPLQHLSGSKNEQFPTVNEAIKSFIVKGFRVQGTESEKKTLLDKIKGELERSRRSRDAVQAQVTSAARSEEYEHIGNVIMASLQHLTKGTTKIDVPDVYEDGKSIHITLDPKLTPARNAERYFEKAKKAKIARGESERQLKTMNERIALLDKLLLHLDQCQTTEQIREFRKEYEEQLIAMKLMPRKPGEEQLPFRLFTVAGGFEVWVGKSSTNNDLLTMKYAKPNDLWFHARGASGSHTVLKISGSNTTPSKEAIMQAASIAAYYSKMRNAGNVPVAYCERKYVRKPKGSPDGTVTLEREKVVFVNPRLP